MMAIMTRGGNTLIEDSVFRMNSNGFHPQANQECDAYFYSGQGATGENDTGYDWDCYFAAGIGVEKWMAGHGTLKVVNTQFIDNNSKDFGGAINISGSVRCDESDYDRYTEGCDRLSTSDQNRIPEYDLEIVDSLFQGNISHRGAAISISRIALARNSYQLGNVKITNSQFIDNKGEWGSAPEGWAGGNEDTETSIIVTGGDLNIESSTFDGNTADITLQVKGTLTCDDSCDGL
jgi:predicted outer membrane repeat protein